MVPLENEDKEVTCYLINFKKNKGYVIVSADYRTVPLFAYSATGSFPAPGDTISEGMALFLQSAAEHVDAVRDTVYSVSEDLMTMWSSLGTFGAIGSTTCDCSAANLSLECEIYCEQNSGGGTGGETNTSTTTYSTKGPLLITQWAQRSIFNDECPQMGCTDTGDGRARAGCVAVAMAQVMRHHRKPSSYDWSSMPNSATTTTPSHPGLAQLIRRCGNEVEMDYGCEVSNALGHKIDGALQRMGYQNGIKYDPFDKLEVVRQIQKFQPVILTGCNFEVDWFVLWPVLNESGCHAWVCDGYKQRVVTNGNLSSTYYDELHMNWGWGFDNKRTDSWTANFTANDGARTQYNHFVKMVIDIKPN